MKRASWVVYFIGAALWANASAAPRPKAPTPLVKITRSMFERGAVSVKFHKDLSIKKHNGKLTFAGGCIQLRDVFENGDYSVEYSYFGDLPINHKLQIVRKQLLNGEQYVLLDRRLSCKTYLLNGRPYSLKTLLVNFNESETTDLQGAIDFWQIKATSLVHVKNVKLTDNQRAKEVRFSIDGTKLLFEDVQGQFWSVILPQ